MERQIDTDKHRLFIILSVFIRVYLWFHFLYCKFVRLLKFKYQMFSSSRRNIFKPFYRLKPAAIHQAFCSL
jgi:hypothetical protein